MDGGRVGERKVYRAALYLQICYLICCACVAAVAWVLLQPPFLAARLLSVGWVLWVVAGAVVLARVQIILSPDGIEYKGPGWHMAADWEDIEGIVHYPMSPGYLKLRSFTVKASAFGAWWLRLNGVGHIIYVSNPLGSVWSGNLESDVLEYPMKNHSRRRTQP